MKPKNKITSVKNFEPISSIGKAQVKYKIYCHYCQQPSWSSEPKRMKICDDCRSKQEGILI